MKSGLSTSPALLSSALLLFGSSAAPAQQVPGDNAKVEYQPGQVWKYKTAPGTEQSTVLILKVEPEGKAGNLIHVRIENLPLPSCRPFHLTTVVEHLAVTEKMLRKSTIVLLSENVALPESYLDAYREWTKHRPKIVKRPLAEVVAPPSVGPLICNWREVA
jgi:hypothetical protein